MTNVNPTGNMQGINRPEMGRLGSKNPPPAQPGAIPAVAGGPGGPVVAKTGEAKRGPLPAKTFNTTGSGSV